MKTFYEQHGYVVARGLFAAEDVARALGELEAVKTSSPLVAESNLRCRYHLHPQTGARLLEALDPVSDLSPAVAGLAASKVLQEVLRALLGDEPRLFKDKAVFKPHGARGYALHQDYVHWPLFPRSFTTAVIALDAATRSNGCIEVFPGLHAKGCLSPLDGDYHDLPESVVAGVEPVALELAPGDVAIFGCFLPHRSAPNSSGTARRQLYLSYNAARDGGDQRAAHYRDFRRWLESRYGQYGASSMYFE